MNVSPPFPRRQEFSIAWPHDKTVFYLMLFFCLLISQAIYAADPDDPRAYSHGIAAIPDDKGGSLIFFSSSGLPPTGDDDDGNWTHDIYMSHWHPGDAKLTPHLFLGKPEAQEPVDVARTQDGHILVTLEDGWDTYGEVEQRYAVYDNHLKIIKPYPQTVSDGGHSGHTAAIGNRFVIFYGDEWIKGGGVDDLGTGNGVYANIYDSRGNPLHIIPVAAHRREWWPLIAASKHIAFLLWQSYIKGETYAGLKFALLDPQTGHLDAPHMLRQDMQYYTYAASYIETADKFLVTGTTKSGHGFAYLIDDKGSIAARIECMPATVREASMSVIGDDIFLPSDDDRLLRLHVTENSLNLTGILPSPLKWSTVGSLGLPSGAGRLHWFSLTKTGLQEADFDVTTAVPPTPQDMCR